MLNVLFAMLQHLAKGGITSWMIQAGLVATVLTGVDLLVSQALNYVVSTANGIPQNVLNYFLLGGLSECLSIIGSAMLTRVAITTAMKTLNIGLAKGAT